jgi:putative MATE family efflux protein
LPRDADNFFDERIRMKTSPSGLTTGSIPRTLFFFSLPILMGNVMQTLNGSINSIWVGKYLGEAALGATANGNTVIFLLLGAVFGMTMASTILIAQYYGAQKLDEAKRVVGTSATFFLLLAVIFSVAGTFLSEPILRAMQTPPESLAMAVSYIRVLFLALPVSYFYFYLIAALRGAGDSRTPFIYLVLSVVLDILLNPVFIFGLGFAPAMGVAGSALATVIAQVVSLAGLLIHIYRRKNPLVLHRGEWHLLRPNMAIVKSLVLKGLPMGAQMIVMSGSMAATYGMVNQYGAHTTAAFAAAMQLWSYVQMPSLALGAGVSSMAAQNIGANHWDRVSQIARYGVLFNFLLAGSAILLLYIFARSALGLFLPANTPALDIALHINNVVLWSYLLFGMAMVLSGVVRAAGAVMVPLIVLFIALWLVRLPMSWALMPSWQADGIWWSFSTSGVVALCLIGVYYLRGSWKQARMVSQG